MAQFLYTAKDKLGAERKGTIETADIHLVPRILNKKGLFVISVKEAGSARKRFFDKIFNQVPFSSLVVITRQLATMIESGLVLSEALDILESQEKNKRLKSVLGQVSRDVKAGLSFALSLRKHPDVFPALYSNLVKVGEESGKLDVILQQMAANLERDREFRARIRGAMIYPALVLSMMFIVISIMMFFVIPRLTSLYTQSNIDLPLPTKILIATSTAFTNYWWVFLTLIVSGTITFNRWVATLNGKFLFDSFLLKVPIIKNLVEGISLTTFTRTFGLLTTAGVPILTSLSIVAGVIGNSVYKRAIEESFKGVERGLPLSSQLEATKTFPKILTQMFKVGEETGKIDQLSFKLADYFEAETDHLVKNLTVVIEPLILIVLGIGVAFLVLSIILPIYKLTTSFT